MGDYKGVVKWTTGGLQYFLLVCILLCIEGCYARVSENGLVNVSRPQSITTSMALETPDGVTTAGEFEQNYTIDDCAKMLERPIDWDYLILEHPGFDDEIFQTIANHFPDVVPACHEKRTWFENMIATTDWRPRGTSTVSVLNTTAVVHHYTYNWVGHIMQSMLMVAAIHRNYLVIHNLNITARLVKSYASIEPTTSKEDFLKNLSQPGSIAYAAFVCTIAAIGIFGNFLTVVAIWTAKHMHTTTNILIGSMAIGEFLTTLALPVIQIVNRFWHMAAWYNTGVCKVIFGIEYTLYGVSVFHLVALSLERFQAICLPMKARVSASTTRSYGICLGTWVLAVLLNIPFGHFRAANGPYVDMYHERRYQCATTLSRRSWRYFAYRMYMIAVQFLIPLGILIFCYIKIGFTLMSSLRKQKAMQERSSKKDEHQSKRGSDLDERVKDCPNGLTKCGNINHHGVTS